MMPTPTYLRGALDVVFGVVDDEPEVILEQRLHRVTGGNAHALVRGKRRGSLHAAVFSFHLGDNNRV